MQIAHLNYFPYGIDKGVYHKLKIKSELALKHEIQIKFYVLSNYKEKVNDNFEIISISNVNIVLKKFFRYLVIEKNFDFSRYDKIILRYPKSNDFSSIYFIKKYGHKIYSEHHTLEIDEFASYGKGLSNRFKIYLEKKNIKFYVNNVRGIIGVTNEIINSKTKYLKNSKPVFLFSNGSCFEKSLKRLKNSECLNFLFVCTVFSPWSGLERLLNSLNNYNFDRCVKITLIGKLSKEQLNLVDKVNKKNLLSINTTGVVSPEKLEEYYQEADACFGTLALYKKNMNEACSLKVRGALSYGKPVIYAYDDTDFTGNEKWNLKFESNDSLLDIEQILSFVFDIQQDKSLGSEIEEYFEKNISWVPKLKNLEIFCNLN